jgi:hypothetical protein
MNMNKRFFITLIIILILSPISVFVVNKYDILFNSNIDSIVLAESKDDHKEEDEKGEDEEDEHKEDGYKEDEVEYEEVVVYESKEPPPPQIRYITIVDPGYDIDTDGDSLVDEVDPDPLVPQQDYFTDTDGDSVPDALDEYPDEDDFAYTEFEDNNLNGIIDILEPNF